MPSLPRRWNLLFTFIVLLVIIISLSSSSRDFASHHAAKHLGIDSASFHPANWLPEVVVSPFSSGGKRPQEWDELGRCLFISPFDALSNEEKARAEAVELVEVSSGVVRAKQAIFIAAPGAGVAGENGIIDYNNGTTTPSYPPPISHRPSLTNPILGLLRDGERKWQDMVSKQSRTLEQAVQEYKDRWNRMPPKGFGEWWTFAHNHGVLLPDEFDPIMQSLRPFWAFPPAEVAKRNAEAEEVVETFTLIITDGRVELKWNDDYSRDTWWASRPRADAQINLMEPFMDKLPDFRATFTIHDQPSILPSFQRMKELLDDERQGKQTSLLNEPDVPEMDWLAACPADSPAGFGLVEDDSPDSFVSSHISAMDPCQHPSLLEKHGMTLEIKNEKSQPKPHTRLLPIMVPSRTTLNGDIPITPVGKDGRRDDVGDDPLWPAKSNKLYWRGLATGLQHNKGTGVKWKQSHRERLHLLANSRSEQDRVILAPLGSTGEAREKAYPARQLSEYYMDVKMSGGPWQCDWGDGSCDEMKQMFQFGSKDGPERSNHFKYVFDTDGNAWSSRFPRLMASRNMVIKASIFPEWNTQTLPEWYAYVPTKMDYSDLYSILAFFRGTPKGKGGHDEVARRIASNGQCWVEKTWRREDMQAYMFRMYLEFARVVSPDRDNGKMDFVLPSRSASHIVADAVIPDIEA